MLRSILAISLLLYATSAFAQQQQRRPRPAQGGHCCAVATQPSNNPFSNPIGQGVPPAASAQPYWNGQPQRRR
ncbi:MULTISPECIES: hypothetical protein [Bradyrhizobium]|uniref:Secreted protein n=1 Tax=Bradyrhizobium arachidis TaxID=858423 RepID=A0AAE7NUN1_9BRAD|nr:MULTISPECIES: hypothetical protein [Bradyrhizobium]QOG18989.1 hypothetical protein FOM02_18220 [Bradyrhizobium sp. SEMIA]QOZ69094.1 hypothetical protein WN72_24305 [Bradyrhizobium arachidis]UFW45203.1 hypothetical protein BaraCB756_22975 [Bradyrhizobium arachidis]SFV00593.1 hypothetical protein SAMN05192541_109236 [Bradyrhizobium arachidis]